MKPFLGIDLTTNKKNDQINGQELLVAKPAQALSQAFDRSFENAETAVEKAKLPLPIRIGQWVCGAVGLMGAMGILRALGGEDGVSLEEAYQNAGWLFWLVGGCLLVWVILKVIGSQKAKTVLESDESTHTFSSLDRTSEAIYTDLLVPKDARDVDILMFYYKTKNGEIKVCEKGMQIASYLNPEFKVFADEDNLYIANLEGKYAVPLSSIRALRTVKKHIRIMSWNKEEAFNKGFYRQYKLTDDNYGCIHCKWYHILEFEHNGEQWGIYVPCYELPVFEVLTGYQAQEG